MEFETARGPQITVETERELTEGFAKGFIIPKSDLELLQKVGEALGRVYDTTYEVVEADLRDQVQDHAGNPLRDDEVRVVVRGQGGRPQFVRSYYNDLVEAREAVIKQDGADPNDVKIVLLRQLDRLGRNRR